MAKAVKDMTVAEAKAAGKTAEYNAAVKSVLTTPAKESKKSSGGSSKKVIGSYQGKDIYAGTDSEVSAQMFEPAVISSSGVRDTIAKDTNTISTAEQGLTPKDKTVKEKVTKTSDQIMADNFAEEDETPSEKKLRLAEQDLEDSYSSISDSYEAMKRANEDAFNANLSLITEAYNERKEDVKQINKMNNALVTQAGIRSVQSRYAPTMQGQMVSEEEMAGKARIKKLDTEYRNAVSKARAAMEQENYALANKQAALILDLKEKAYNEAVKQAEYAQELNQKTKEKKIQASRDLAVADLLSQGVSDPAQMLDLLNFTEDGKMVGDFTADEIKDALTNLVPSRKDDYAGLSTDLKEFYTMKDLGLPLPAEIAALPESQQPFSYVKYKGELERKATNIANEKSFTFSNTDKGTLIGAGLNNESINHIQEGINEYGLAEVLKKETGLTDDQKLKLTKLVSGVANSKFITAETIKNTISDDTLRMAANEAGYDQGGGLFTRDYSVGEEGLSAYIENELLPTVEIYREMGYTDKEILTKIEAKFKE